MSKFELEYKRLLEKVLAIGEIKPNRTGVYTYSLFNQSLTIDVREGFPIVTGKKVFFEKARAEYNWMRDGLTTTAYLNEHGIRWWDEYADRNGYLGKTYGYQLRSFNGEIDQFDYVHRQLREKSRRAHITLWNPSDLNTVDLPPCFTGITFRVVEDHLDMSVQFRSSDLFLGLPYDIVVFALMHREIAEFNELKPRYIGIQITDAHIYANHITQVNQYRDSFIYDLPRLRKTERTAWHLINYKHGNHIPAKMNN